MTRLRQLLVVLVGLVLAGAMVLLGIWQLDVYHASGRAASEQRAAEDTVELTTVAPAGGAVRDGYGRTVRFTGSYDPAVQQLVTDVTRPGRVRVLTALRLADGRTLAVVRGETGLAANGPPMPPVGPIEQSGIFLPSEKVTPGDPDDSAVVLPVLVQTWPGPLVDGFVTLSTADAEVNGMTPPPLVLPEAAGRLRNGAYAVQWWLFAAFTLVMGTRMARDLGRREVEDAEQVAEVAAGST